MRRTPIHLIGCAILIFWSTFSLAAGTQYLHLDSSLEAGHYQVGFKAFHEYDHGRSYAPKYAADGSRLTTANPRPMQIAVWYPAKAKGQPMPFKEYVYLDDTKDDFHPITAEVRKKLDEAFVNQQTWPSLGTINKTGLRDLLDQPTTAYLDAPKVAGTFPLLLFINREYRGIHSNTVLMEYLASHGYIVATTPSKDRVKSYQQGQSDIELVLANLADIQFVKRFMHDFPNVDREQIGVIGYFVGSLSATLLSMEDPNVDAVANIQSLVNFKWGRELLEKVTWLDSQELRAPHLDFFQPWDPNKVDEPWFFRQAVYADYHNYRVDSSMDGLAFSSFFNEAWMKPSDKHSPQALQAADQIYGAICRYTLKFFDGYLKDDSSALAFIRKTPGKNHLRKKAFEIEHRKAVSAPPTANQFVTMIKERGFKKAKALYLSRQKDNPHVRILSDPNTLNAVGYEFLGQERNREALAIFQFNVDLFPKVPEIVDSLAEGYMKTGDTKAAITHYRKVLEMKPRQAVIDHVHKQLNKLGVEATH